MPSTAYNKTAKDIIKNSITSAIFIDDNLGLPFKAKQDAGPLRLSRALYNSFTKSNVSLDFYKYSSRKDWQESKDFLFKSRDLLVLDWQLDSTDVQKNTLQILEEAVNTPSLHFVCIYTDTNPNLFPDIAYSIKAYFSKYDNKTIDTPTTEVLDFLDTELNNGLTKDIKDRLKSELKLFSLSNSITKESSLDSLKQEIVRLLGIESANKFQGELGKKFKMKLPDAFEAFGYGLNEEFVATIPVSLHSLNFFMDNNFILLDNTVIRLTNKRNPNPGSLYSYFTSALLKSSGNFLSLLSLDLKNILKRSSGFISKELDMIDEVAFFYHKDNVKPEEAFFDFVLELWKSNLASLLYSQNHLIKLFDEETLEAYRAKKKIDGKIKKFKKRGSKEIDSGLAKLNYYYNIIQTRDKDDFLRFGDIFNILDDSGKSSSEYLLCITAHCDCLYVENIKNEFFFVKGKIIDNNKGLVEGDSGINSFIKDSNDNIVCINWAHKPFTIYIENNRILRNKYVIRDGKKDKTIYYSSTLKENYAQRVANNAFSHPMRVGIFFAKKEKP